MIAYEVEEGVTYSVLVYLKNGNVVSFYASDFCSTQNDAGEFTQLCATTAERGHGLVGLYLPHVIAVTVGVVGRVKS